MKNLLKTIVLFLAIIASNSNAIANNTEPYNTGGDEITLLHDEHVVFSVVTLNGEEKFSNVTYNNITKMIKISAVENIAFVEIKNQLGETEYVMPVGAKVLNVDLLDFEKGEYTVNLKLQGVDEDIIISSMTKTF